MRKRSGIKGRPVHPVSEEASGPTGRKRLNDWDLKILNEAIKRDPVTGCWIWRGRPDKYGSVRWRGKTQQAHRLLMSIYTGSEIPSTHHVHHKCERKGCVNPAHLLVLTPRQHREMHAAGVGGRS